MNIEKPISSHKVRLIHHRVSMLKPANTPSTQGGQIYSNSIQDERSLASKGRLAELITPIPNVSSRPPPSYDQMCSPTSSHSGMHFSNIAPSPRPNPALPQDAPPTYQEMTAERETPFLDTEIPIGPPPSYEEITRASDLEPRVLDINQSMGQPPKNSLISLEKLQSYFSPPKPKLQTFDMDLRKMSALSSGKDGIVYANQGNLVVKKSKFFGIKNLRRERNILSTLPKHKNIIELKGKVAGKKGTMVLEKGLHTLGNLTHRINNLSQDHQNMVGLSFIRDMLSGSKHLQANGIENHDMHDQNFILGQDGALKIIDLGRAKEKANPNLGTVNDDSSPITLILGEITKNAQGTRTRSNGLLEYVQDGLLKEEIAQKMLQLENMNSNTLYESKKPKHETIQHMQNLMSNIINLINQSIGSDDAAYQNVKNILYPTPH